MEDGGPAEYIKEINSLVTRRKDNRKPDGKMWRRGNIPLGLPSQWEERKE